MKRLILCAVVCIVMVTGVAKAGIGHDVAPETAEALYDVLTGELFFDVGERISVVGFASLDSHRGELA